MNYLYLQTHFPFNLWRKGIIYLDQYNESEQMYDGDYYLRKYKVYSFRSKRYEMLTPSGNFIVSFGTFNYKKEGEQERIEKAMKELHIYLMIHYKKDYLDDLKNFNEVLNNFEEQINSEK